MSDRKTWLQTTATLPCPFLTCSSSCCPPATRWRLLSPSCLNRGPFPSCPRVLILPHPSCPRLCPACGHLATDTEWPPPVALAPLNTASHSASVRGVTSNFSPTADWVCEPMVGSQDCRQIQTQKYPGNHVLRVVGGQLMKKGGHSLADCP